jgi:hypothetical protein
MRRSQDVTKSKFFKCALVLCLLSAGAERGFSLAFTNLNFESANVSGYPAGAMDVPVGAALPGWTAFAISAGGGFNSLSQVWYDGVSGGGTAISINDANLPFGYGGFGPISGKYSLYLFAGEGANSFALQDAGISQTGLVPFGTESLAVQVGLASNPFIITLNGQIINMVAEATLPTYTEYGGDVSAFAGKIETLTITETPPTMGAPPGIMSLDDIVFSTTPVPEPGTLTLLGVGAMLLGLRRWRNN